MGGASPYSTGPTATADTITHASPVGVEPSASAPPPQPQPQPHLVSQQPLLATVEAQAAAVRDAAALRRELEGLRGAEARARRALEEREAE